MPIDTHNYRYSQNSNSSDSDSNSNDSEISIIFDKKVKIEHMDSKDNLKVVKKTPYASGYLKVVLGCMFSGKTTYIVRECKKWQSIGKNVLMINYILDTRYTNKNEVVTHDQIKVDCVMLNNFNELLSSSINNYDVILVNEGQFFSNLRNTVLKWCDDYNKIVVVSGLDGDYMRGKFGEMTDLIPDCDEIIKLKAYCSMCADGTDALFSWKLSNNDNLIDIGSDNYVPLCRYHYNKQKSITFDNTIVNKSN